MAAYQVVFTKDAENDLEDIYDYIHQHDSQNNANLVLEKLLQAAETLAYLPEKGSVPNELQNLGIREYRQVLFKPYRIIYRITGKQVAIFVVTDSRRDMQMLLTRRLFER